MKFTCHRQDLAGAVSTVERAVATKETDETLTGIHLGTEGGRIRLSATDLELGITCSLGADVAAEGSTVLDTRYFSQIVRRLPGDDVSIEILEDGRARVRSGRVDYTVRTLRAENFPGVSVVEGTPLRLPENVLRTMIRQTVFSAAVDDARPILTGVLMEAEGPEVRFVATDSNRLAFRKVVLEEAPAEEFKALVPARALQELLRILGEGEEPVEIVRSENRISFELGGVRLVTRLLEGQFPNYRHVIPDEHDGTLTVQRTVFIDALERSSLLARRGPAVATLVVNQGLLKVQAREADVGQVEEELDVEQDGKDLQNAYQVRFLLEALKALDGEQVRLAMNEGDRQATLTAVGDPDFLYILMPVRL